MHPETAEINRFRRIRPQPFEKALPDQTTRVSIRSLKKKKQASHADSQEQGNKNCPLFSNSFFNRY